MWFKSANVYQLGLIWDDLEAAFAKLPFAPCGDLDMQTTGFIPPRDGGKFVHVVGSQMLFAVCTEKRNLPSAVVNRVAAERAAELEEQQGFKPGRKQMRELKEQVTDELLPRAFTTRQVTPVWLDPVHGLMVVDGTDSRADAVFKLLLKAVDKLPVSVLRTERSPVSCMTDWLAADEAPAGFTIDQDAELRSTGEGKATVRYIRHTLEPEDLRRHIAGGKQCTRLAMTWADRVSFVLTESLHIKRITPLDILKESSDAALLDADERFDADFALMAGELAKLIADIVAALGGLEVRK